tara:strand:- start:517 stop:1014 length:498 start_codon:yes stop_codon:yes gene_type:complete
MTYIKHIINKKINGQLNIYYNGSATIGQDEAVSWSNLDSSFSNNFSLTKSGSQFTLPNDGKTYILESNLTANTHLASGGLDSYVTYQWYDVTNSTYVGIKGYVAGSYNYNEGRTFGTVADEKAMFITSQNNSYELRILEAVGIDDIDDSSSQDYAGRARCCIWRF